MNWYDSKVVSLFGVKDYGGGRDFFCCDRRDLLNCYKAGRCGAKQLKVSFLSPLCAGRGRNHLGGSKIYKRNALRFVHMKVRLCVHVLLLEPESGITSVQYRYRYRCSIQKKVKSTRNSYLIKAKRLVSMMLLSRLLRRLMRSQYFCMELI